VARELPAQGARAAGLTATSRERATASWIFTGLSTERWATIREMGTERMTDQEASSGVDWPSTVESAVERLLSGLSEQDKATIASTPESELLRFHHGWGTGIRNDFGLWRGNQDLRRSCVELGGPGSGHPDGASAVIVKAVWNRIKGLPLDHHQRIVVDSYPCERCGGPAEAERFWEDEPSEPPGLLCRKCASEMSPQKQQERRENEVARAAFDKAKLLGEAVHHNYVALRPGQREPSDRHLPTPSDDQLLIRAARDLYVSDETFHDSWNEVKGEEPGPSHLPWLRLWKRR